SESVRGEIPAHECSSWENRRGPSERSWTRSAVHFAPMISAVAATAHDVASWTGFIVRIAIRIVVESVWLLARAAEVVPRSSGGASDPPARTRAGDKRLSVVGP